MARFLSRRTTQILLVLLALFLGGTVVFLSAVNAYFSIDKSTIIRPSELGTWEEIELGGDDSSLSWKARYPWLAQALSLKPTQTTKLTTDQEALFDDALARHAAEAAKAAGFGDDGELFIPPGRDNSPRNWTIADPPEKIPRIIHQTWKDKTLPSNWQAVRDECAQIHPDYKYMLWTDADSRQFIVDHYSWFVPTFDAYPYPIQRADAIRYFILHYYGGIYMDLDVGCLRRLDPLLRFEVILPKTIPVGVSNDVIASAKGHPFMDHLIHNLVTFDHRYLTHYPTVMFSTGPMFVSASFGLYVDAHGSAVPSTPANPSAGFTGIRILPKILYGKNAKPSEAPDAFFRHFYGSSWHANDADFLIFLRDHGRILIFVGFLIAAYGLGRSLLPRIMNLFVDRKERRSRSSRRGRWISLPIIRDSSSGRFHSVAPSNTNPGDSSSSSRLKVLSDESTQTGLSPTTATGAAAMLGGDQERREGYAESAFIGKKVAAPRPQRMPMFDLQGGGNVPFHEDDEDVDLGPGLNAEGLGKNTTAGLFHRMWDGLSHSSSVEGGEYAALPGADVMRSGSASKYSKGKANTVLYLPAYFVGGSSSSASGSSTTDSALTMNRINEEEIMSSPNQSASSSSSTPLSHWNMTQAHARTSSGAASAGFSNWAASFLPSGTTMTSIVREASPTLQRMLGGINLSGRTPSPSTFAARRMSSQRVVNDLESRILSDVPLQEGKSARAGSADRAPDHAIEGRSGASALHPSHLRQSFDADIPPPYHKAFEGSVKTGASAKDEDTPTL
ncbi:hypothetical protein CBS101457_001759 [Exobasidium rhododendri]|nr:hypothetical protein CBS101457_001759 [Exobasidium rhododendri]